MKKTIFLLCITFILQNAYSQDSGVGIGVVLGEPTGLSGKIWTGEKTAIDAALAWSFAGRGFIHMHADLLIHSFAIDVDQGQLPLYLGIGAKLEIGSSFGAGIRVPLGVAYLFESAPVDAFFELVPVFNMIPATVISLEGGVGIRYFF